MMATDPYEERARLRLGQVLRGKYRLDRVLGVGGMAVVYKATHRNQAEFAIKMLHPELSMREDIRNRFLREGYAANSVKHPGVVRIVDDDVAEDGAAFLVMDLLDGLPCDGLAPSEGGRVPIDVACSIALQLLEVLAAAHAQGIIHRDIKPANLFVLRDGTVTVLDFGIARVRDTMGSGAHATGTGMLLGTPAYMAPEQAIGKASDIDVRADIWAVGATIFGLASGENVHDAETAPQLLVKLATEQPRSLATRVPTAPPAVVAVVDRALMLDKVLRWPTAVAMRDALGRAMQETFGAIAPRALLASVVAAQTGRPTPVGGAWDGPAPAFPPTPPPSAMRDPTPRASPRSVSRAGGSPIEASTPPVVDTGSPVSGDRRGAGGRRSARRVVLALIALSVLGSALGLALFLRPKKGAAPIVAIDSVPSTKPSAEPHEQSEASAPNPALEFARGDVVDAAVSDALTTTPAVRKEPPRREIPRRPQLPLHSGQATSPARPESPGPPQQPPSTGPSPAPPPVDPIDGRR
ncbi:MAG TPA: serine/threonine-protein kinase [Polyangiaceae bacterium]|jgi:serine/threonine-protein kinase|nr:serine/threonine-protein kinase [Polyangiaceae bacterium]